MGIQPIFKKAYWTLAACGLVYLLSLLALTNPVIQRNALYAHKVNPSYWQDINDIEQFGFLKGQVQPFNLRTPDNETLYAWHALPAHVYAANAPSLVQQPAGPAEDHSRTEAFRLLASNPNARVVITFHGNAAHIASSFRPTSYISFLSLSTPSQPVHVLTFDYRGFGYSTGSPTELGLITDAVSFLDHVISVIGIPPARIVLVGQSLGTAVVSAVAEHFAINDRDDFAGVILAAGFGSLPKLLESYSIKGIAPPILAPLRPYPYLQNFFRSRIADHWNTTARIARIVDRGVRSSKTTITDITILHARDDWEIPWREGRSVFDAAVGAVEGGPLSVRKTGNESEVLELNHGRVKVRWEKVAYGGHNRVVTFQVLPREILRAFEKD